MKSVTVKQLNELNRAFYHRVRDDFDRTRSNWWSGWERILPLVNLPDNKPIRVLDVGCGNGRFLKFFLGNCDHEVEAVGIDSNEYLLTQARDVSAEYIVGDLVEGSLGSILGSDRTFDLIVVFGLLHHVPSFERRKTLLHEAVSLLSRGGLLIVSAWQFGDKSRFRKKVIEWETYAKDADIDIDDLEERDFLLSWGDDKEAVRYCHYVNEGELTALMSDMGVVLIDKFLADGKSGDLNLYGVYKRG